MRWAWSLAVLLIVLGLIPVLSLSAATVIGTLGNCRLHEGFAETCMIGGRDWGGSLRTLGTVGWFFFLTAPIALAGFVLGIMLAVGALLRRAQD